jgi:hypothetical protein
MPATAAIDNETLDHLLSVVDDSLNLGGFRDLSKAGIRAAQLRRVPKWDGIEAIGAAPKQAAAS